MYGKEDFQCRSQVFTLLLWCSSIAKDLSISSATVDIHVARYECMNEYEKSFSRCGKIPCIPVSF